MAANTQPVGNNDAYSWMDLLRWLAATLVLISHARDLLFEDYSGSIWSAPFYVGSGLGHSSVILFFVLSGFWIARTVLRRTAGSPDAFWTGYLIDRLSRLWVVLLPALVVGYGLDATGLHFFPESYSNDQAYHTARDVAGSMGVVTWIGNVFFQQSLLVDALGSNGPLWSLAFEFWFYLWFPALLLAARRPSLWLLSLGMGVMFPQLIGGFACWLAGAAVAASSGFMPVVRRPIVALSSSGVSAAAIFVAGSVADGPGWAWDFAIAATFALFLFVLLRAPVRFPAVLMPLARFGSRSSFSLYVIHFPLLLFGVAALGLPRAAFGAASLGWLAVAVAVCTLVAIGFSNLTEAQTSRVRDWARRRARL
ncbi:MAG: acyltransferase [Alphaproteobacteria bacterium]|nr:acyltransferase [Alphaproteobacteria bacterium]